MEEKRKTVNIYTDGACSGNPGPGGWAAILEFGPHRKELSGFIAGTTTFISLIFKIMKTHANKTAEQKNIYKKMLPLLQTFTNGVTT